jgi:outer membrane protein TolC
MFSPAHIQPAVPARPAAVPLLRRGVLASLAFISLGAHADITGLTLDAALQRASQRSASNQAATASVQAMQEAGAKAGQLPDPTLKLGVDNLPVTGPDKYSIARDFMTMRRVGVEQQWVSSDKRAARTERAKRAVEMEEGNYLTNVALVREETAKAWVNVFYAQKSLGLYVEIEKAMADDFRASQAAHRGAKANASEVLQTQIAVTQAHDSTQKAEQDLEAARISLARWIAEPVQSVAGSMPPLVSHVADMPVEDLERYHPMVLTARRSIALADADTEVAVKDRRPDWSFEASFSQRGSQYSNMVSVGVSIPLTTNPSQKQDRDIAEKSALGTKARLQYQDALRELQSEIQGLATKVQSSNKRSALLKTELVPAARQQIDLATAAYRSGSGSLSAVFAARKMLVEKQLQIIELEKDAAMNWASLEYHVVPHDMGALGGTTK